MLIVVLGFIFILQPFLSARLFSLQTEGNTMVTR